MENAHKLRKELVDAGIRVQDGRARRHEPRLQVQRLGDARRAAAPRTWPEGRRQGLGSAGPPRPPRQRRESLRAAAGHRRSRDAVARRNPAIALRSRPRVPQSQYRRARRLRRIQEQPWKRASPSPGGAAAATARPKSRKRPKPPCAASPSSSPAAPAIASIAASQPKKKPSSPRLTSPEPLRNANLPIGASLSFAAVLPS